MATPPIGAPLILVLELAVLYIAGSYAITRLAGTLGSGSAGFLGRVAFYLLVLPGVALHETAHYLGCILTGTKVLRLVPFWPQRLSNGRLLLGYVRHERRPFLIEAIIGLAPIVLNPLGILLVTALLTPLTFAQLAHPEFGIIKEDILASSFLVDSPLIATTWVYLAFSFALGSVPSREDLSSVPAALVLFGGGIFLVGFLQQDSGNTLIAALCDISVLVVRVYALPAVVAAVAAVVASLWDRMSRY